MTNKRKQLQQAKTQSQSGRSMVEMLGVLAIIGVLSIGGIAGYRWGMDKHVSNQILYEMNLNSAQLAMLLQKGNPDGVTLSLGSPYDEGKFRTVDYGFDYGCEAEVEGELHKCFNPDETGYFISALNLPERIANMVIESAPNLQYYVDYEETVADEVENKTDVTIFFDINADATESLPDSEVTQPETTTEPKPCDDCIADDQYCDMYIPNCNESDGSPLPSLSGHQCYSVKDSYKSITVENNQSIEKTFYISTRTMDWWAAEAFCNALKSQISGIEGTMVNLGDLECQKEGYCSDDSYGMALANKLQLSDYFGWTSTKFSSDFCRMYNLNLSNGYIGNHAVRNDSRYFYALCK